MDSIVYIARQLSNICPADSPVEADIAAMRAIAPEVDARFEFLVSRVKVLARTGKRADPWHVMKHPIYLYLLSRALFESGMEDDSRIKDRLYCLNKALHGCSLFYKVRLPKVFFSELCDPDRVGGLCLRRKPGGLSGGHSRRVSGEESCIGK